MRDIKFRAWNKKEQKMMQWQWLIDHFGLYELFRRQYVKESHIIPMQFTGLKDINGVDIYEGDIVKVWFSGMPNNMRCIQEITFSKSSFGCGSYPFHAMDISAIEVIGNIHETQNYWSNHENS